MVELTPESHPESLALISNLISPNPPHASSAEALHIDTLNQNVPPLLSSANPSLADNPRQPAFPSDPPPLKSSSKSTSPQYYILISEAAICDKSKANRLAKLFAVIQTTWFIVQFIARSAIHQPRTQLEVMTVAYATLNAVVYALWWNKPYNVNEPINVSGRAHDCARIRTIGILAPLIYEEFESSIARNVSFRVLLKAVIWTPVAILFAGLHCLAWQFHFPTEREAVMWRVCAMLCTVGPVFAVPAALLAAHGYIHLPARSPSLLISQLPQGTLMWAYLICRFILLGITLSSLRELPAGAFETTAWTKLIRHNV